jgi:hypothetical protein
MEIIVCPYCECKVDITDVDDEGGVCPECGALITGSLLLPHEGDELEPETDEHGLPYEEADDDEFDDDLDDDDD